MKQLLKPTSGWMLFLLASILLGFSSCKKDSTTTDTFTFVGRWTINYNYTTGNTVTGSFTANLKSNNKWDYTENSNNAVDCGNWSSSGNNVTFTFGSFGDATYNGSKGSNNNSLSGTMVADAGVSTGTWTATRQ